MSEQPVDRADAAAFWGIAENRAYSFEDRLKAALKALEFYGTLDFGRVDGVEYTPEAVESLRQNVLIPLRDAGLDAGRFEYAVGLSHVIAYMAEYKEILEARV